MVMTRAIRFGYFLQLNGDSDQGQSTGRPEDGHEVMEPRTGLKAWEE